MEEASSSSDYPAVSEEGKEEYPLLEEDESYNDDSSSTYHSLPMQHSLGSRRYNVDVQVMDHSKDDNMYYQDSDNMSTSENKGDDNPRSQVILDQERFLPIANVARIMKRVIPESGKLAKEAKECVQECVSEFISFLTSEASDKCLAEKRRTITADDLLDALASTGLVKYVDPVKALLNRHKASNKFTNSNGNIPNRGSFADYQEQPTTSGTQAPISTNSAQMVTVIPTGSHPFSSSGSSYAFVMQPGTGNGPQLISANSFIENNESELSDNSRAMSAVQENSHNTNSFPTNRSIVFQDNMLIDSNVTGESQQFQIITQQGPIFATGEDGTAITLVPGGEVLNGEEAPSNQGPVVQTQNMQIYVDPVTKQHYVAVETPDGPPHLFPITIKDEPVTMNIAESGLSSGSTSFVVQTTTAPKPLEPTEHSDNSNDGPPVLEPVIESRHGRIEQEHIRRTELGNVRSVPYIVPSKK
ncbi:unnamed protein product [Auanema sp. JU1783]|nr:unnamed protein product [Auanema sp. JU1783]